MTVLSTSGSEDSVQTRLLVKLYDSGDLDNKIKVTKNLIINYGHLNDVSVTVCSNSGHWFRRWNAETTF